MYRKEIRKRKKRHRRRLVLIPLFLIIFYTIGYGSYLTFKLANATDNSIEKLKRGEKSDLREDKVDVNKDNFSVLFIGVDAREGERVSRSDALILATFNKKDNSVKMVSIPRDSYVEISGVGMDKINHAHAYGGVDLAVKSVENLFDVPVDHYVRVDFKAFIDIVDALGGVEVNVPKTFSVQDSKDRHDAITLHEGNQQLDGEEALAFVRMRKQDPTGDIGRGERQRQVIKAIIEKGASFSSITKYDDVIDGLEGNIQMDLNFKEIVGLHGYAGEIDKIDSLELKGENSNNGVFYYILDETSVEEISNSFKAHLELDDDKYEKSPEATNNESTSY
ncbi:LCP family protein [Pseudalkalibacillus salsuginis]|uniref:LCP family protein n=1 Tax=Pseudalkalibacillus salsuginis TaxID=2910972 RepID=UPI001F17EE8F|nr:LCP family protein [Pseudalkalibacillus salsuginis]MCF6410116.1 LCP family protein [Pseudalkalibacillus salsuginis]